MLSGQDYLATQQAVGDLVWSNGVIMISRAKPKVKVKLSL
jgi:hypothetical protein